MNTRARAALAARIFDIVAWAVLALGGIGIILALVTALGGGGLAALLLTAAAAVYTALVWAAITLGTVVASYIAEQSQP